VVIVGKKYTGGFDAAADTLKSTVVGALRELSNEWQETPLEAAEHLQAIIIGAVTKRAEYASLYDEALVTPRLYEALKSDAGHEELARRWGTTEQAVRRTRKKFQANGIPPVSS
jgi:hypothetical protein